jgi:putative cell wall-binding protein
MRRRILPALLVLLLSTALLAVPAIAESASQTIISPGPLNRITVTDDLNCDVERGGIYSFYGRTACGTFLGIGGTVYGPEYVPAGPAAPSAGYAAWQPQSQSSVTGGGTVADPFRVTTTVLGGGVRLVQKDSYATGAESLQTTIELYNTTAAPLDVVLYRAGDCYFGGDDAGFGEVDPVAHSATCVEPTFPDDGPAVPGEGFIRWLPHQTEGASYYSGGYPEIWTHVRSGQPLPNECEFCDEYQDNAGGIAWSVTLAAGASVVRSHDLVITKSSIEPAGVALVSSGSVMVDPRTGELVIAMPPFDRSDVTISAQPRCEPDGTPASATLVHGTGRFPMTLQADGRTFTATIPAGQLQHNLKIVVEYDCAGTLLTLTIGTVNLYDPSGFVTDIITGAPVVAATVTLYQVPGWRARTAGEADTTPETCQSVSSKPSPDAPWTQPAPTELGVVLDPTVTTVSPSVQPFITDHRGYYGWDVPAGCFYVVAAHANYQTLTSPVVGVPPEVLDLDLQMTPLSTAGYPERAVARLAGTGRAETAAEISRTSFAPNARVAFIATQANFPDALAGGPAAALGGGPILLTGRDAIPAATVTELQRLRPQRIVVLGGGSVVSDGVLQQLGQYATTAAGVSRLSGPDRFATAAEVSKATFPPGVRVAYVATGTAFPDALTGGAAASRNQGPVLLVQRDAIPAATVAELQRLAPKRIVVLGGTAAVSDAVLAALQAYTTGSVSRTSGPDRFATASAVAATFPSPSPTVFIATGSNFPDALAGVPVAGLQRAAILLVPGTSIPTQVRTELARLKPHRIFVLGGEAVVSRAVLEDLQQYLR